MAETNEVQALEKVSTEVDKSQIKIILSNQCIKAQAYLYDKLRKQSDRQKEICKFISSSNQKLEAEIRFAEQEIKSLNLAIETIKFGNTELKKGYLLCKERMAEILERTKAGKTKYENIWLTSKCRYENIPSIKKIIDLKNKNQTIQASIKSFMNDSKDLINKIEKKRADLDNVDKAHVIELAQFIVYEKPKTLEMIKEKKEKIKILSNEIEMILNDQQRKKNISNKFNANTAPNCEANDDQTIIDASLENNQSKNIDKDTLMMPKLHLQNNDLDMLSIKLHQIKKIDLQNISQTKRAGSFDFENISPKKFKTDENVTKCNTIILIDANKDVEIEEPKKCSDKKLIHILEDIRLEKIETYNIINKLQPNQFQETKFISSNIIDKSNKLINSQDKISKSLHVEEIEIIDLTPKNPEENVVAPPSQFVDIIKCTQQGKKTVSFNIPKNERIQIMNEDCEKPEGKEVQSPEKILNCSTTSEESYTTIKDMVLKKHNLDLSPQFMYTKNPLTQKQEDKVISSKFFENKVFDLQDDDNKDENQNTEQAQIVEYDENNESKTNQGNIVTNVINVGSTQYNQQENNIGESISGFLFNHGPEGIPESLNVSISTTGFDDSEEFPQCIDSSILLSPKADLPMTVSNCNNQVLSQEVPNFLAGFRKKGFSFFGSNMSEPKPDSSAQNQNSGFNFSFGNDEKKGRGGLFNMFR